MRERERKVQSDLKINKLGRGGHDGGTRNRQIRRRFPERAWRDQGLQRKCKYTEIKRSGGQKETGNPLKKR